ncbi:MAG: FAD-dependent oxidoreductase [Pseudomonadota bacterium]|jgi:4-cresol dehydrogenase (hydroxylating)|nr:FAD-dependent oxidoreductase [Pseudomonadota bacterium]
MAVENFAKRLEAAGLALEAITDRSILHQGVGVEGRHPEQRVRPASVEELALVLPAAKASGVSLWIAWNQAGNALVVPPAGGAAPVLLELSRLNRIVEVDAASGYALVEPGVSYAQLAAHLKENGLALWLDAGADADASITGSIWERSFGYTAYGDRMMMQCGMEVMQTDGSLVRTGMGAMPGENSWQLFKYGFGPYADGIFTQSAYAVTTKMGFWVSPQPPAYRPFVWRVDDDDRFVAAMEAVRSLRINMVVPNTLVAVDERSERRLTGEGDPGGWNIYGALYGLEKNVDAVWTMLEGLAGQLGGITMQPLAPEAERTALMSGRPAPRYRAFLDGARGRMLRLCFAMPIEGDSARAFVRGTHQIAQGSGCQIVIEQGTAWRSLLAEAFILFEPGAVDSALELGRRLITHWAQQGIGVVRASPALQPVALQQYSDAGFVALRSRLEEALA